MHKQVYSTTIVVACIQACLDDDKMDLGLDALATSARLGTLGGGGGKATSSGGPCNAAIASNPALLEAAQGVVTGVCNNVNINK